MRSKPLLTVVLFMLTAQAVFAAAPTIASFSPTQGYVGTLVTITGANLGSPTAFTIGGKTAIVVSNTGAQLVAMVMPGSATGAVNITTAGGSASGAGTFTILVNPEGYPQKQQGGPLVGTNGVGQPYQGNAVAISADNNTAVVAGYNDNSNQGAGWFYTRTGGMWTQQGAKVTGAGVSGPYGAYFGSSVSISADGNTAIFGGPGDNVGTGATWVFTRSNGVWTQQGNKLVGTGAIANNGNPEGNAQQGQSVSLSADGNTAVVGGWFDNGGVGAAWIFTRSGTTWIQQGNKLLGTNGIGLSYQGHAVAMSADGKTALVGGPNDNSGQGATWVFTSNGGVWTQQTELIATGNVGAAGQGGALSLSADGNTAILGGSTDSAPLGAAWIFTRSGTAWSQQTKLVGSGGFNYSYGSTEGASVTISADGNTAVIGGSTDSENLGAIWVFTRSGTTWTQQGNKLTGTGTGATSQPNQGSSVAITADGSTVIEGGPANNTNYGIAYVFTPILPTATTETATNITATTVTLYGLFSANGISCNADFQYSTSPALAGATTTTNFNQGSNPVTTDFDAITSAVTGLTPATKYYWIASAYNLNGTVNGVIDSFTTAAAPPPPPPVISFTSPGDVLYGSITTPIISSTDTIQPFHYQSTNPAIAAITADNKFHAVGVGSTTITAYQYAPGTTNIEAAASGNIIVNPAPITVTADNKTVPYGQPIPPLTVTYKGFVNSDTTSNLTTQATVFTQAQQNSAAGIYAIHNDDNASDPNYSFNYVDGTLTITQILPVPTAETATATSVTPITATLNGTASGQGAADTITFEYTTNDSDGFEDYTTVTTTSGLNPLPPNSGDTTFTANITGLLPGTTYYFRIVSVNGEFTVNGNVLSFTTPAALNPETITFAQPASQQYGSPDFAPGASSTNTSVAITYTSSNTAVATITASNQVHITGVGSTQITASQAADATHSAAIPVTQTFTVTPAPLTITAGSPTSVYGSAIPTLTVTYNGFVNNDSPLNLTTPPSVTTTAQTNSGTGAYPVSASGAVDLNYAITYVAGNLTITPASLTITANDQAKLYGAANPALTLTYTTFVNNDTQASLTTQPVVGTTATSTSAVGPYPITVSGAADSNYTITYTDGTLTINAVAPAAVTLAATAITASGATLNGTVNDEGAATTVQLQYGQQPDLSDAVTAALTSGVSPVPPGNGTTSFTSVLTGLTPGVTYYFRISGTNSAGTSNGSILSFTSATILAQTITFPAPVGEVYGSADVSANATSTNSTIPITYTSSNTAVATVSASGTIHIIGVGSTQITASQAGNASYSAATPVIQTFTVTPAALTITADDLTRPYNSINPTFTFTYSGFVYSDKASGLTLSPAAITTAVTTSEVGTYPITVSGAASPNYTITYVDGVLTVAQAKQTIDFAAIPPQLINADYDLKDVSASSGLPVVLTLSDQLIATLSDTILTSLHPGTESVTASQPGDKNYLPATDVTQTFDILQDNGDDLVVNPVVSPNGDGIDDVLNIKGIENYPVNHLVLINRNGVKIFEITNYNNVTRVFDGHSNITGAFQQQGTLLYILEYTVKGKSHRKTGFTVLRY